jgi:hypothetical protein
MLYFAADKNLGSPFGRIWEGVEGFLELCEPSSRDPKAVMIFSGPPRPEASCDHTHQETAVNDGTSASLAACHELYRQAKQVWRLPFHAVYVRWEPWVGPAPRISPPEDLNHQLAIWQVRMTGRTWAAIHLLTGFSTMDRPFLDFVEEANRRLPCKLQPARWRTATAARSGRTILRKVQWPS